MRYIGLFLLVLWVSGCAVQAAPGVIVEQEAPVLRESYEYSDVNRVPGVAAALETTAVETTDDAADDPAIWINPVEPAASLILGTDKKAGVAVYSLNGKLKQFLSIGQPNNIDLRQAVTIDDWQGDIAIASNRADDTVTVMSVSAGGVEYLGDFPSALPEPYGACIGILAQRVVVFVTYKDGNVLAHQLVAVSGAAIEQRLIGQLAFAGQLEGCVVDDAASRIFIGEEAQGIWRVGLGQHANLQFFDKPVFVDQVGSDTGIVADIEGVALYRTDNAKYLLASSQGNDSYAVYDADVPNRFLGRFRVIGNGEVDGVQETDGIAVSSASFGRNFPVGLMVAQDGFNAPAGSTQNFKVVDWRLISAGLGLATPE